MFCLFIFLSFVLLTFGEDFDPDIDICRKTLLDAAVHSDDDFSYIFKGKYFWRIKNLDTNVGNTSYADLIINKWPELKGEIKAVFTVQNPKTEKLVTVFVVNNRFYAYEKGVKVLDGSTDKWLTFDQLQVSAAFEKQRTIPLVFVLHTNNTKYTFFNFSESLSKPGVSNPKFTYVRDTSIFFVDNNFTVSKSYFGSQEPLSSLLDVRAAITYTNKLFLIGSDKYCIVNLKSVDYEKLCNPMGTTSRLIGCPINIEHRPTTPVVDNGKNQENVTNEDLVDVQNDRPQQSLDSSNNTSIDTNKTTFYAIAYNSTLICLTIILMVAILLISKLIINRSKGTIYYIK